MREKARQFLDLIRSSPDTSSFADEMLVFFYDLHDHYHIAHSTSTRFKGKNFSFLSDLLYNLESRPDETMKSDAWKGFCEMILEELATGRILVAKR